MTRSSSPSGVIGETGGRPPSPLVAVDDRVPQLNDVREQSRHFRNLDHGARDQGAHDQGTDHRRTQIQVLLTHYRAVLEGVPDRLGPRPDDLLALMCPSWNHASYQQLERLLRAMPPRLRAAIRARYERYTEKRVAWCRVCNGLGDVSEIDDPHLTPSRDGKKRWCKIGPTAPNMLGRLVRVLPRDDDPKTVDAAIDWLNDHWKGPADLPKAVFEIEAEQRLRAA